MFPESSLTPENLSTVLHIMNDGLWYWFGRSVNISDSELVRIRGQYSSDRDRKQALIPYLISKHPSLSWTIVARALYQLGARPWSSRSHGDSCHGALDVLQQLFPTGIYNVHVYCTQVTVYARIFHIAVKSYSEYSK